MYKFTIFKEHLVIGYMMSVEKSLSKTYKQNSTPAQIKNYNYLKTTIYKGTNG